MAKRKTNVQVVTHLMNYSAQGALMQGFILNAMEKYSKEVIASEPWSDNSMISFAAWKACAEEVLQTLENHYGSN